MRAAQYLRMSTEHQNYSLAFQAAHNRAYAAEHGYDLVRDYEDSGVSGLTLKRRAGLRRLLADVMAGEADFQAVLVYDVSRWGRFQDPDQAAHYEFLCKAAGVAVIYTAEPFTADGGLMGAIVKQLRRAMAADYSRDLSDKVARAQRGLQREGYWLGGPPGYGLRRMAVDRSRVPGPTMEDGEQKALRGYRTVLIAGPAQEVAVVRRIFRQFNRGIRPPEIAAALNQAGIPGAGGGRWSGERVHRILRDEKYAGVLVGGKTAGRLGARGARSRKDWLRIPGASPTLVSRAVFRAAQGKFRVVRKAGPTDEALLDELRLVLAEHGRLSVHLINAHPEAHCAAVFQARFGGLMNAYRLLGYTPSSRQLQAAAKAAQHRPWRRRPSAPLYDVDEGWRRLQAHYAESGHVSCASINDDPDLPSADWYRQHFGPMPQIYARLGYAPARRRSATNLDDWSSPPYPP